MVVPVAGAVLLIGGCGSSSTSSSGTSSPKTSTPTASASSPMTSPSPSMSQQIPCAQINALKTSLVQLTSLKVTASTASQINAQLKTIQAEVGKLKSALGSAFATQLDQLSAALSQAKTAAQAAASNPSSANIQALTAAMNGLKKTVQPMAAQLKTVCPSSSP